MDRTRPVEVEAPDLSRNGEFEGVKYDYEVGVVLLILPDGSVFLQHRDDIPSINDPDTISPIGGSLMTGEDIRKGTLRELSEELPGLKLKDDDLIPFMDYTAKTTLERGGRLLVQLVHAFVAHVDTSAEILAMDLREARPFVLYSAEDPTDDIRLSRETAVPLLKEWFKRAG